MGTPLPLNLKQESCCGHFSLAVLWTWNAARPTGQVSLSTAAAGPRCETQPWNHSNSWKFLLLPHLPLLPPYPGSSPGSKEIILALGP